MSLLDFLSELLGEAWWLSGPPGGCASGAP